MVKPKRSVRWLLFILYLLALSYFLFFSEAMGRRYIASEYHYNLTPLLEIKRYVTYWRNVGAIRALLNLAGNVIAFLPFGFFLPAVAKEKKGFFQVTFCTIGFSLMIETIQLITKVGSFDVDDILLNTLGGCIGYLCFYIMRGIRRTHAKKK